MQLGKLVYMSNAEEISSEGNERYSSGEAINTYSKAYGGRGFRVSPEVLEFKRKVVSEYEISD